NYSINLIHLSGLTNLTSLGIEGINPNSLTPISSLTNLTYLSLSKTDIQDISIISHLTQLSTLNVAFSEISNFEPLFFLSNLKALDVHCVNKVKEGFTDHDLLNQFNHLPQLSYVNLNQTRLKSREEIAKYLKINEHIPTVEEIEEEDL